MRKWQPSTSRGLWLPGSPEEGTDRTRRPSPGLHYSLFPRLPGKSSPRRRGGGKSPPTGRPRARPEFRCQGNHTSPGGPAPPAEVPRLGLSRGPGHAPYPAPHPGNALLAAQSPQHLGHVAHHAWVLHAHHAPLAPQIHGDRDPRPRVSRCRRRRRHPCQSGPARRGPSLRALLAASPQWFRERIVPGSLAARVSLHPWAQRNSRPLKAKARGQTPRLRGEGPPGPHFGV